MAIVHTVVVLVRHSLLLLFLPPFSPCQGLRPETLQRKGKKVSLTMCRRLVKSSEKITIFRLLQPIHIDKVTRQCPIWVQNFRPKLLTRGYLRHYICPVVPKRAMDVFNNMTSAVENVFNTLNKFSIKMFAVVIDSSEQNYQQFNRLL